MVNKAEMRSHAVADLFPLMPSDELEALAADIKSNGQLSPILTTKDGDEDVIVDGRNRYAACRIAGVEPTFESVNGTDPLTVVLSANVRRRKMLTKAQLAIAAAESWPLVGGAPAPQGGRPPSRPETGWHQPVTRAAMAARWEVSEHTLKLATALVERDPDAAAEVKNGSKPLEEAYKELLDRERAAQVKAASLDGLRERHSDLAELVVAGKLTLADALAAGRQREQAEAEERSTRTRVLVELNQFAYPASHATRYVECFDPRQDPAGAVSVEKLRTVASFAEALADLLEGGTE